MEEKTADMGWQFAPIWNEAIISGEQRTLSPRDHLWASELFYAPIDIYLKMRGTEYTNPPNERARRKFEAGYFHEWVVGMLLKRAGILQGAEMGCEHQYEGLLKVTGRLDKLAGGKPDFEKAKTELEALELPPSLTLGLEKVIEYLNNKYPEGLGIKPIEIKSVSSFAMDVMEEKNVAINKHRNQLFHYLKSKGYESGILLYLCRDDMRMAEFNILLNSPLEEEYKNRIALLTENHAKDTPPEKEKMVIWDKDSGRFSKNLNLEYSPYLKMLYGFETPREYSEQWGKVGGNWTRVLKRVKDGAKMTVKNEEVLEAIRADGYDIDELVKQMPDKPIEEEPAE